jgi:hypothetical protein
VRRVLPDRKGEEVDGLEVLVYRVAGGRHAAILPPVLDVRVPLQQ